MSTELAEKQAESQAETIREDVEAGHPFGVDEDGNKVSAFDFLSDVLDITYRIGSDRSYKSAEILIGFGGPNVWIDTADRVVRVAWWSPPVERSLPAAFIDALDEAVEELWEMDR